MPPANPSQLPARTVAPVTTLAPVLDRLGRFGGDSGGPAGPTTDWRRLRSVLWRFKWLVISLPLLSAAGGYGVSRLIKPDYTARATLWINRQPDVTQQKEQFGSEAWIDLFRSYEVIDRVVSDHHLSVNVVPFDSDLVSSFAGFEAKFTPGNFRLTVDPEGKTYALKRASLRTAENAVIEQGPVGGPVGKSLGFKWTPPASSLPAGREIAVTVLSPRQAAVALLDHLRVTIDQTGTFLHAELTGRDPDATAAILNSMVQQFVRVAARLRSEGLSDRSRVLGDQLASAQRDLASAEAALQQFRSQTVMRPGAGSSAQKQLGATGDAVAPQSAAYFSVRAARDSASREDQAIRRALSDVRDSGLVVSKLEDLPSVKASSELSAALKQLTAKRAALRDLQVKYTDLNPIVVKARSDIAMLERTEIPEMANRAAATLAVREGDLSKRLTSTETDLRETPALDFTETRLRRNVTVAEGLYSQLRPQFAEAQIAEGSVVPDVRPLDPAEAPQFGDKILTTRLILIAFLAGLGLACAGVIGLDRMDPKFRYPDQVSRELGLSILGALPHVTDAKNGKPSPENAAFQEAIRDLRMNVEYAYGSAGPLMFTVSSAGPADGKSFLSSNLAMSFAASGRRTLLVDGDLRRGELHRRCGVSRRPGLTDCLRSDAQIEQVIQQTKFPRLHVVASGARKHDAPELLGSPAAAQLLGEFRSRYDVIICDSPPLSAGIEPFVLSALSGNLLLVVRTGVSVREVLESKLEVLGRMPVRILGAVLNDVPRSSIYGYYSSYVPGYDTSDESGTALERIIV